MVYVDDARHRYGRLILGHVNADTDEELVAAARKYLQKYGLSRDQLSAPSGS